MSKIIFHHSQFFMTDIDTLGGIVTLSAVATGDLVFSAKKNYLKKSVTKT